MHDTTRRKVTQRLKRVEGQVGGVLRMVEDNRYCIDLLTQISAMRAALHKVEEEILRDHLNHCVADAFASAMRWINAIRWRSWCKPWAG